MEGLPTALASVLDAEHPLATFIQNNMQQFASRSRVLSPLLEISGQDDLPPSLNFADRHLAHEHLLQRVVHVPSMVNDLKAFAENKLCSFLMNVVKKNIPIYDDPLNGNLKAFYQPSDASRVAEAYTVSAGNMARQYVSKIFVHPDDSTWDVAFLFRHNKSLHQFVQETDFILAIRDPKPINWILKPHILKTVDSSIREKLTCYGEASLSLAIFSFFSEINAGEFIIDNLLNGAHSQFPWSTCKTVNAPSLRPRTQYRPMDAPDSFCSGYHIPPRQKAQVDDIAQKKVRDGSVQKIRLPSRLGRRNNLRRSDMPQFLQRAWSRAVENDATFIVLNCGNKERIGIRQRSTNTLFLSDVIDPFAPGYGSIHIGLQAAIVQDVLARPVPFRETAHPARSLISRPDHRALASDGIDDIEMCCVTHPDIFNQEMSRFNILLVSLSFAHYQSEAPSAFSRHTSSCHPVSLKQPFVSRKLAKTCDLADCINFVAHEEVSSSYRVVTYRGRATIQTCAGEMSQIVILKVPKSAEEEELILHEYEVYRILSSSGVTDGILMVHGVFQDIESGMFGLLLQDGGITLYERERRRVGETHPSQFHISADECARLKSIVGGINSARIRHGDIKPDNLCINSAGEWFVFDFDRSEIVKHPAEEILEDVDTVDDIFHGEFRQGLNYGWT